VPDRYRPALVDRHTELEDSAGHASRAEHGAADPYQADQSGIPATRTEEINHAEREPARHLGKMTEFGFDP
jgi:hypothetical protein